MPPNLRTIDHVHVYVSSQRRAETWYRQVLGLRPVEALQSWKDEGGPATLENAAGDIHLALFEQPDRTGGSAIAFGCDAQEFVEWQDHFRALALELRLSDHRLSVSMYFADPDGNTHEITTYQCDEVRALLAATSR